ncbi:MAG: DUF1080 domain-containing protein [Acidobacteria bacterium]|nr:DUF1080 domain-containing protein [Acidobacteriota bacterium]MCI0664399.1 DUF1080 domain-containing protein [Acidobacteriota bacterium]
MRIKLILLIAISACVITALAQTEKSKSSINQLTSGEKTAGWRLLFDGKTFNGWRGFHSDKVPAGWVIEDGSIKKIQAQGELGQAGGDLITVDQFSNFELRLEWKLSPRGNSGIKYLVSESLPPTGRSGISFEYQVLDDDSHPDAKQGAAGTRTSGAVYDLIPPSNARKLKPVGEFNQVRIIVKGNHIEHWLNGIKVVEFDRTSADFKQRIAKSKFKDTKGFGEAAKGHVLLQDHGNAVWYRNIKIRELK